MNLYHVDKIGKGHSYVAPDPLFISSILIFSSSLPWAKFEKFFKTKKLVNITPVEQLTLLRLIALQEILCISDDALLRWTKNQLYLFSFMQADFKPRLPTVKLLNEFRTKFDEVGLLKPFRKQCQRLIQEHENRFPPIEMDDSASATPLLADFSQNSDVACPSCGSFNNIKLAPSQVSSSLPNISFSRCRFCGNTFRDDNLS